MPLAFMAKRAVQVVGGRIEAQVTVVDSSGIAQQPAAEQGNADQEQQDLTSHSELLRSFDATMQRWQARVCIPEYLTHHKPAKPEKGELEQWTWEYGIAYPITNPPRIAPKKSVWRGPSRWEDDEIGMEVFDGGDHLFHDFTFTARGNRNDAFKDPYTGEEIVKLKVNLQLPGENERIFYAVSITEDFYPDPDPKREWGRWSIKTRNLEYAVGNLNKGKPYLHIQKTYDHDSAELLSEPHALTLFNLMDTLIPPSIAAPNGRSRASQERPPQLSLPQPGRRATPELKAPRQLPAPRRRRLAR